MISTWIGNDRQVQSLSLLGEVDQFDFVVNQALNVAGALKAYRAVIRFSSYQNVLS